MKVMSVAFHALHAVYHERDFRVRVNDPVVAMVRRVLAESIDIVPGHEHRIACPACAAGYSTDGYGPKPEDR